MGDAEFQARCFRKLEAKRGDRTLVLVTHDLHSAKLLCERGILLEKGRLVASGPTEDVVETYLSWVEQQETSPSAWRGHSDARYWSGRPDSNFELVLGELNDRKKAALPAVAARGQTAALSDLHHVRCLLLFVLSITTSAEAIR